MADEPLCAPGGPGLGNVDLEKVCGQQLNLDSQDHNLTYSLLQALVQDGLVEQIPLPDFPRRPKCHLVFIPRVVDFGMRCDHGRRKLYFL